MPTFGILPSPLIAGIWGSPLIPHAECHSVKQILQAIHTPIFQCASGAKMELVFFGKYTPQKPYFECYRPVKAKCLGPHSCSFKLSILKYLTAKCTPSVCAPCEHSLIPIQGRHRAAPKCVGDYTSRYEDIKTSPLGRLGWAGPCGQGNIIHARSLNGINRQQFIFP